MGRLILYGIGTGGKMTDEEKIAKLARYRALMHAVQTGIGWEMSLDDPGADVNADPNLRAHKHLRVGIDGSKADLGGLARLLIQKGLITDDEYIDAILEAAELEKSRYEAVISEKLGGRKITLA